MNRKTETALRPAKPISYRDELVAKVLFDFPLPVLEERLLVRLLYLANSNANVRNVSEAQLALNLGVTARSIRNALTALEATGIVQRERPKHPQSGESTTYHIDGEELAGMAAAYWSGYYRFGADGSPARQARRVLLREHARVRKPGIKRMSERDDSESE